MFHINSNGQVTVCKATKNRCQFGDATLHFATREQATAFIARVGNIPALRGKKTTASALHATPTRPVRVLTDAERIFSGAVTSPRWEAGGLFSVKITYRCGECLVTNYNVRPSTTSRGLVIARCSCNTPNLFRLNDNKWLVIN